MMRPLTSQPEPRAIVCLLVKPHKVVAIICIFCAATSISARARGVVLPGQYERNLGWACDGVEASRVLRVVSLKGISVPERNIRACGAGVGGIFMHHACLSVELPDVA